MSGYYQGHPQGGHPPPQQGYGYQQPPPPQGYGQQPPLQNQFQHNAAPPPGPYGAPPPQGQYGGQPGYPPPMPHQQQQWGPPGPHSHQQQHFQPPPTQQGISAPPSPGYDLNVRAQGDAGNDVRNLRAAMEGIGSDKVKLIKILSQPDPLQMALLLHTYDNYNFGGRHPKRNLIDDLKKETSGHLEEGLIALARGPLVQDCHNVHSAIKGLGTKESVLNDVLLGRSNADMRAIKTEYHRIFHKSMESDVKGDLSLKTEDLFRMVMSATRAEESAPIYQQQIDQDADALHHAIAGLGTKQEVVCNILSSRSDGQIRAIAHAFSTRHGGADLEHKIRSDFSGHMQDALLLMVRRATDRAMCDAVQLEESMAGIGTNDSLLVNRVVRVHWTRQSGHLDQVRRAYSHRYKRDLIQRVKGETSGKFENLLVACLEG